MEFKQWGFSATRRTEEEGFLAVVPDFGSSLRRPTRTGIISGEKRSGVLVSGHRRERERFEGGREGEDVRETFPSATSVVSF